MTKQVKPTLAEPDVSGGHLLAEKPMRSQCAKFHEGMGNYLNTRRIYESNLPACWMKIISFTKGTEPYTDT